MNGAQDMGGVHGFGPVEPEPDEPVFHAEWEKRAFALTLAMAMPGQWNLDMSRFARENRDPAEYLSMSYYQIWFAALEAMLMERELITDDEIVVGRSLHPPQPGKRVLSPDDVLKVLHRGGPTERDTNTRSLFKAGDKVRAKNIHPLTHTRLPRYVRGHIGTVEHVIGYYVFPDSNSQGKGEQPQWLYTVVFGGDELWGPDGDPTTQVSVDAWEIVFGASMIDRAAAVRATQEVPSVPRDADGPVFREPWEAQAFAITLALHERGLFSWKEWAETLGAEIKRAQAEGDPDTGETYYLHWLAALERLVAEKGVTTSEALHRTKHAWEHACERTPHGKPIELIDSDFS